MVTLTFHQYGWDGVIPTQVPGERHLGYLLVAEPSTLMWANTLIDWFTMLTLVREEMQPDSCFWYLHVLKHQRVFTSRKRCDPTVKGENCRRDPRTHTSTVGAFLHAIKPEWPGWPWNEGYNRLQLPTPSFRLSPFTLHRRPCCCEGDR